MTQSNKQARDQRANELLERAATLHATVQAVIKAYVALPGHNPAHYNSLKDFQRRAEDTWWLVRDVHDGPDPPRGFRRCPTNRRPTKDLADTERTKLICELEADWTRSDVCSAWFGPSLANVVTVNKSRGRTRSGALQSKEDCAMGRGTTPQ